jgi:hypothetical protein
VTARTGVVNVLSASFVLVFKRVPPVAASYHLYFPPVVAPEADKTAVVPIQINVPVTEGDEGTLHVVEETFIIPVVTAKYVSFLWVAPDPVLPQDPDAVPLPPIVKVPAECVNVRRLAKEPAVIEKLLLMVFAAFMETPAALLNVRLETVEGSPFPVT